MASHWVSKDPTIMLNHGVLRARTGDWARLMRMAKAL
jgi:hypothetical protein